MIPHSVKTKGLSGTKKRIRIPRVEILGHIKQHFQTLKIPARTSKKLKDASKDKSQYCRFYKDIDHSTE